MAGVRLSAAAAKAKAAETKSEGLIAALVKRGPGPFSAPSLARSYNLTPERVAQIIIRNGGACA